MKKLNPLFIVSEVIESFSTVFKPSKESGWWFAYNHRRSCYAGKRLACVVATSFVVAIVSSFTAFNYWYKLQDAEQQLLMAKGRTQMMAFNVKTINYKLEILNSVTKKAIKCDILNRDSSLSYTVSVTNKKEAYLSFN